MRILHVICTTDLESGGPIEAVHRIAEVFARDGHRPEVVSLEPSELVESRSDQFPCPVTGVGEGIGRYRFNPKLIDWIRWRAVDFDVVVAHGVWNFTSAAVWQAMRGSPIPYFVFTHGMLDPWFRDAFPVKHWMKQAYWALVEGKALRDARAVLFTCEEERLRARGVYRGYKYREQVVQYGTARPTGDAETEKAAFRAAFPQLAGKRYLLFISRIHPKKGCDLLIDAFADCLAELPPDLDLVMAGPDQVGQRKDLEALAARRGVADRVHWTGMLKDELKWGAFRTAEAMILPSHQENFGFVVAEAMVCGTPVLISNKVNIWREVLAAKAGFVEPDTPEGTRNLIRGFMALTDGERAQMKLDAEAGFTKYFDSENTVRALAATLRHLCAEPVRS
jgi:glycosyltransferase involved in cell wall biosynthesis